MSRDISIYEIRRNRLQLFETFAKAVQDVFGGSVVYNHHRNTYTITRDDQLSLVIKYNSNPRSYLYEAYMRPLPLFINGLEIRRHAQQGTLIPRMTNKLNDASIQDSVKAVLGEVIVPYTEQIDTFREQQRAEQTKCDTLANAYTKVYAALEKTDLEGGTGQVRADGCSAYMRSASCLNGTDTLIETETGQFTSNIRTTLSVDAAIELLQNMKAKKVTLAFNTKEVSDIEVLADALEKYSLSVQHG